MTTTIAIGTIREFIRIVTCKRSTGNEGDTYRRFNYWNPKDALAAHPIAKSNSFLWTRRRLKIKAVWDGKHWREIGGIVNPK